MKISSARRLVPPPLRSYARRTYNDYLLVRAIRRFMVDPLAAASNGELLDELVMAWGNDGWSAHREYLAACIEHAWKAGGASLECGSGLSTLLVGAVAQQRGHQHWALEHDAEWGQLVGASLQRFGITAVRLCCAPLRDYGDYTWYDPPLETMPDRFPLAICDGPPASTPGGRYGFMPVMCERLPQGAVILLDDAEREDERLVAARWLKEISGRAVFIDGVKPYLRVEIDRVQTLEAERQSPQP